MLARLFAVRRYRLFATELATEGSACPAPPPYLFRALTAADFTRSTLTREKQRAERFAQRLAAGHRCFGFVAPKHTDEEIAFYLWLSGLGSAAKSVPLGLGLAIGLGPEIAYVWDCRTASEHRRRGLYREALRRTLRLARAEGAALAVMAAEHDNEASRGGILAAGFRESSQFWLARFGPVRLVAGACRSRLLFGRGASLPWQELANMQR